jgi:hypothetical protein
LVPFRANNLDGYTVAAAETGAGTTGSWRIEAYAICAPDPNNLLDVKIEGGLSGIATSKAFQTAAGVCPAGKVALGTGARVNIAMNGEVVLQLSRASGTGDISRAQAQETPSGYSGLWNLTSYAICAKKPAGYEVVSQRSPQELSEDNKVAVAHCSHGKRLHGGGGAITAAAPPNVSLSEITALFDLGYVQVRARENTPYGGTWDWILAQAICAY